METLDDIVRYSAFALMTWLGVLMLRDFCDRVAGRLGAYAALSSAAFLIASKPGLTAFGVEVDLFLLPLYDASPALAWLFCLSQFDDNFKVRPMHWTVVAAKLVTGSTAYVLWTLGYGGAALFDKVSNLIVIGMLVHLIIVAWQGRHEDLVEARRKFRSIFVTAVVVMTIGILLSQTASRRADAVTIELLLQAMSFLGIAIFLHWRLSAQGGEDLFFTASGDAAQPSGHDHCELSPADQHDLDVILELEGTELILEPGLTISKLARRLKIPEHRVRHLINQHMGYRNFADFLNHHRIQAAKSRLSDANDRNTPVLTVAMDMGYGSLGPFNRAFKERTGLTPTEFRLQSLMDGVAATK